MCDEHFSQLVVSPVARLACGTAGGGIHLINLDTGETRQLTHTDNGPLSPSWNPTGDSIVYVRILQEPGEDRDSVGLHLIDLATGDDSPIRFEGRAIAAGHPTWSPSGGRIAFGGGAGGIFVTDVKGSRLDRLTTPPAGLLHDNPIWIEGGRKLLFEEYGNGARTWEVDADGRNLRKWPFYILPTSAVSPGDSIVIGPGSVVHAGVDEYIVIFRRGLRDAKGLTRRPITFFVPLQSSGADMAARGSIDSRIPNQND